MGYDIDFQEEAMIKFHIKKFLLYPEHWNLEENKIPINLTWSSVKFNETNIDKIPTKKGIYAFTLKPEYKGVFETNYLFYIGKTNRTLKTRFKEYINDFKGKGKPRKKVFSMLKNYSGYLHFYFAEISSTAHVDKCENLLINTFVPHVNVTVAKAKVKPELQYIYE